MLLLLVVVFGPMLWSALNGLLSGGLLGAPEPATTTTTWTFPSLATPSTAGAATPGSEPPSGTASYAPVTITGRECVRRGSGPYAAAAAGNDSTSCQFAAAVREAYLSAGAPGTQITVSAFSQARGSSVPMTCSPAPVACESGDGAVVFLYGGEAVIL